MSRKASSRIADRKMEKNVRAYPQPCLTPFMTLKDSDTSSPALTFAIIPVCSASSIVVNYSGQSYFRSSCHSPVLQLYQPSYWSRQIVCTVVDPLMPVSCTCWRQNIISTVFPFPLKPNCVSGTTSGVMWINSLLRRILAKISSAMERREIPLYIP